MTPANLEAIKRRANTDFLQSDRRVLLAYVDELTKLLYEVGDATDATAAMLLAENAKLREVVAEADAWVADVVRRGHLEASFRGLKAYRIARKKLGET